MEDFNTFLDAIRQLSCAFYREENFKANPYQFAGQDYTSDLTDYFKINNYKENNDTVFNVLKSFISSNNDIKKQLLSYNINNKDNDQKQFLLYNIFYTFMRLSLGDETIKNENCIHHIETNLREISNIDEIEHLNFTDSIVYCLVKTCIDCRKNYEYINEHILRIISNNDLLTNTVISNFTKAYIDSEIPLDEICKSILSFIKEFPKLTEYISYSFIKECKKSGENLYKISEIILPLILDDNNVSSKNVVYEIIHNLTNACTYLNKDNKIENDEIKTIDEKHQICRYSRYLMENRIGLKVSYKEIKDFFHYIVNYYIVKYFYYDPVSNVIYEHNPISNVIYEFTKTLILFNSKYDQVDPEDKCLDIDSINQINSYTLIFLKEYPSFKDKIIYGFIKAIIENSENPQKIITESILRSIDECKNITEQDIIFSFSSACKMCGMTPIRIFEYLYKLKEKCDAANKDFLAFKFIVKDLVKIYFNDEKSSEEATEFISNAISIDEKITFEVVDGFIRSLIILKKDQKEINAHIIHLIKKQPKLCEGIIFGFIKAFAIFKNTKNKIVSNAIYIINECNKLENTEKYKGLKSDIILNFASAIYKLAPNNLGNFVLQIIKDNGVDIINKYIDQSIVIGEKIKNILKNIFSNTEIPEEFAMIMSRILIKKYITNEINFDTMCDSIFFLIDKYPDLYNNIAYKFTGTCVKHIEKPQEIFNNYISNVEKYDKNLIKTTIDKILYTYFINKKTIEEVCEFTSVIIRNHTNLIEIIISVFVEKCISSGTDQKIMANFVLNTIKCFPKLVNSIIDSYISSSIGSYQAADEASYNISYIIDSELNKEIDMISPLLNVLNHDLVNNGVEYFFYKNDEVITLEVLDKAINNLTNEQNLQEDYMKGLLLIAISKHIVHLYADKEDTLESLLEKYNATFCKKTEKLEDLLDIKIDNFAKLYSYCRSKLKIGDNRLYDYYLCFTDKLSKQSYNIGHATLSDLSKFMAKNKFLINKTRLELRNIENSIKSFDDNVLSR